MHQLRRQRRACPEFASEIVNRRRLGGRVAYEQVDRAVVLGQYVPQLQEFLFTVEHK